MTSNEHVTADSQAARTAFTPVLQQTFLLFQEVVLLECAC